MYEICTLLLRQPKARKARAPRKAAAKIGAKVVVYDFGRYEGTITAGADHRGWFTVEIPGHPMSPWQGARKLFEVV